MHEMSLRVGLVGGHMRTQPHSAIAQVAVSSGAEKPSP